MWLESVESSARQLEKYVASLHTLMKVLPPTLRVTQVFFLGTMYCLPNLTSSGTLVMYATLPNTVLKVVSTRSSCLTERIQQKKLTLEALQEEALSGWFPFTCVFL